MQEDFEREVKVIIIGNGNVGKTSMIHQFCKDQYPTEYKRTIGVDFLEKTLFVRLFHEFVKLMLWDTAGQEQFSSLTRAYYKEAKAAVLCFSTIDRESFTAISDWKKKVEEECGNIPMVLVQNKVDLLQNATVSREEAEALASDLGVRFYRICVKRNFYVDDVFEYVAELHLIQAVRLPHIHENNINNSSRHKHREKKIITSKGSKNITDIITLNPHNKESVNQERKRFSCFVL